MVTEIRLLSSRPAAGARPLAPQQPMATVAQQTARPTAAVTANALGTPTYSRPIATTHVIPFNSNMSQAQQQQPPRNDYYIPNTVAIPSILQGYPPPPPAIPTVPSFANNVASVPPIHYADTLGRFCIPEYNLKLLMLKFPNTLGVLIVKHRLSF